MNNAVKKAMPVFIQALLKSINQINQNLTQINLKSNSNQSEKPKYYQNIFINKL